MNGKKNGRDYAADEVFVTARGMDTLDLLSWRDRLRADIVAPAYRDEETDAVATALAECRFAVVEAEIGRRNRAARLDQGIASPSDAAYGEWVGVAKALRDSLSVPRVISDHLGLQLFSVGRDKRGRTEYAGACLWCGGDDRFRAWDLPDSRYWCRQCDRSGDVIQLWREYARASFCGACLVLAHFVGMPVPESLPGAPSGPDSGPRRGVQESHSKGRPRRVRSVTLRGGEVRRP